MNNLGEFWELVLSDMCSLASHIDGFKYILNAIDAFSKYAYSVPKRSKTNEAVAADFRPY